MFTLGSEPRADVKPFWFGCSRHEEVTLTDSHTSGPCFSQPPSHPSGAHRPKDQTKPIHGPFEPDSTSMIQTLIEPKRTRSFKGVLNGG